MQYDSLIADLMNDNFARLGMPANAEQQSGRIFVYYNDPENTYDSLDSPHAKHYLRVLCRATEPTICGSTTRKTWDQATCQYLPAPVPPLRRQGKTKLKGHAAVDVVQGEPVPSEQPAVL